MSIEIVKTQIDKFLKRSSPEVFAIKGGWGVGKTYSWNEYLKVNSKTIALDRYSYVSLFGINTVSELKQSIFENIIKKDLIGTHPTIETFKQNRLNFFESWGRKATWITRNIPVIQDFSATFDSIAFITINKILICIDDIERRGKDLTVREIFGLVTQLKEQKDCKIVLLLNDNEEGLDEYTKYREKVIDAELIFDPSSEECNNIAFEKDKPVYDYIKSCCALLNIRNIRVLKKIRQLFDECTQLCKDYEPEILTQIAHSLVLFSWSFYYKSKDVPTIEYICKTNYLAMSISDKKEANEDELKWNAIITSYGYEDTDELDRILANTIQQGYILEYDFIPVSKLQNEKVIALKKENSFSQAWKLYHNYFEDNQDEVIKQIYESFKKGVKYIERTNLNGAVLLLRDFDQNEKASEIIDIYIDAHKSNSAIFDLSENGFYNEITDQEIKEKFSEAFMQAKKTKSAREVILDLASHRGWNPEDEEVLANTSADEYYSIFKSLKVDNFPACINVGLRFGQFERPSENYKKIYENVKAALFRIGCESKINKRRLIRYGIIIE